MCTWQHWVYRAETCFSLDVVRAEIAMWLGWSKDGEVYRHKDGRETREHPIGTTLDAVAALLPEDWHFRCERCQITGEWTAELTQSHLTIYQGTGRTEYEARLRLMHLRLKPFEAKKEVAAA